MIFNVGAGGNNAVYLTQAEYDALPDSKLSNGVEYRITDANVSESIASNLAYDNTYSGIQAVNVQTAIDEVNDSLNNLFDNEVIFNSTITTSNTNYNLISGKKISDYRYLIFCYCAGATSCRGSMFLPISQFTTGYDFYVAINANGLGYGYCNYVNDTSIRTSSDKVTHLTIYGIK